MRGTEALFLGAVYVSDDVPGVLPKGFYYLRTLSRERIALINQEGVVIGTRHITWFQDPEALINSDLFIRSDSYVTITASSGSIVILASPVPNGPTQGGPLAPAPPGPGAFAGLSIKIKFGICTPSWIAVCLDFGEVHL